MLPTLLFLAQVVATPYQGPTDARPVRLWLGASPVATGDVVPVYVAAANDGYLLVLRVATDGRVDVVFPADPQTDGRVARGAYELRAPGNRPALVATEGRGTGLVLAALSETPFRFRDFASAGRWDRGLLVASYAGADGPGTLTDIAQRMLGDGWFNYDFALYTVRTQAQMNVARSNSDQPRADARGQSDATDAPTIGVCNGCTIVYQTVSPEPVLEQTVVERTIVQPVVIFASICEPGVGGCGPSGFRRHRPLRRDPPVKAEGICQIGIDCPAGVGAPAQALSMRRASLSMSPVGRYTAPTPPLAAPDITVPVPVRTPIVAQRVGFVSKAGRDVVMSVPAPVNRVGGWTTGAARPTEAAPASQSPTRTMAVRTGGVMTARQAGTAMRAARIAPRRP